MLSKIHILYYKNINQIDLNMYIEIKILIFDECKYGISYKFQDVIIFFIHLVNAITYIYIYVYAYITYISIYNRYKLA